MRGGGDDREGTAGAAADVRAVGVYERFDGRGGAQRPADRQVRDQRKAPLGPDVRPSLQLKLTKRKNRYMFVTYVVSFVVVIDG